MIEIIETEDKPPDEPDEFISSKFSLSAYIRSQKSHINI